MQIGTADFYFIGVNTLFFEIRLLTQSDESEIFARDLLFKLGKYIFMRAG